MANEAKTVREALNITPEEFMEMGRIGAMYYEQGKYDSARKIFEGLVELDPTSADAHAALGGLFTQIEEDDKALVHLKKAIEIQPEQIAPYVNLGEVYLRKHNLEESVANLKIAVELDPKEQDGGANRARAMLLGLHEAFEQLKASQKSQETDEVVKQ